MKAPGDTASTGVTTRMKKRRMSFDDFIAAGDTAAGSLNYDEAIQLYHEAMQRAKDDNPRRLEPNLKLGSCLREMARYQESEKILLACINGKSQQLALNPELHLRALQALAALYQAQSKYESAVKIHNAAVPMARSTEGLNQICLANTLSGYAETLRKSGDLPNAEQYHREALEIRTHAVAEGAVSELELAVSYTQLGCTLSAIEKDDEAYEKHQMALTLRYRYLDFSHGLVSESLNYCAASLRRLGRGEEGIPLALHALQIRKSLFGVQHPAYAHTLSVLASCYHAVGRYFDACDCLEKCLVICEMAFQKNHANIIPNLMYYGDVLRSLGHLTKTKSVYERAISIHELHFKGGQQGRQLDKCKVQVKMLAEKLKGEIDRSSSSSSAIPVGSSDEVAYQPGPSQSESKGTPVIVITDIGRDVDDEMALVLLSSLKRKRILNPIAVVTTLAPQEDRANLARGSLDTLAMATVPVGVGGRGGLDENVDLEVYAADHSTFHRPARTSKTGESKHASIHDSGIELILDALEQAEPKTVRVLILASMSDVAMIVEEHEDIFVEKVSEVVIMGGVEPLLSSEILTPDTAYNNNCDMESARLVYTKCQELRIPTVTLSRWAAYGCPVRPCLLDELAKTKRKSRLGSFSTLWQSHSISLTDMIASNVQRMSKHSLDQLWRKVILPDNHPGREKLPSRCNTQWFMETFCDSNEIPHPLPESPWTQVKKLNMYDPLAVLVCCPSYRDAHFYWQSKNVDGVEHKVIGTSSNETGVKDSCRLYSEYSSLFLDALKSAMNQPELPLGREKDTDLLSSSVHFNRAA